MNIENLQPHRRGLLIMAIAGLFGLNGVFVYAAVNQPDLLLSAARNPISLAFMLEAFVMVGFGAWIIHGLKMERPGWPAFVVFSLLGGLAFSVPLFLLMHMAAESKTGGKSHSDATNAAAIRTPPHHSQKHE